MAEPRGQAGGEDDGHEEAEVYARRDAPEEDGRKGEEGEANDVEDQGEDDAVRVVGAFLELGEEEHGGEARHGGDGEEGGGKGGEEGMGGAEAVLEVGGRREEHVPGCSGQNMVGWSQEAEGALLAYHAHSIETPSRRKMEYSSHEKRGLRTPRGSLLSESSSRGS